MKLIHKNALRRKQKREPSEHQKRVELLSRGLAQISRYLIGCGLGSVNLGKLSRHMLTLRDKRDRGFPSMIEHFS